METRNLILLAQFFSLATVTTTALSAPDTPATIPGVETVDLAYVAKAVEEKSVMVVDVRAPAGFNKGTIPGAINCPGIQQDPTELTEAEVAKASEVIVGCSALGKNDKARDIVTFCRDAQCWISPKAALALVKQGFTRVKWYRVGYDNWKAEGRKTQ